MSDLLKSIHERGLASKPTTETTSRRIAARQRFKNALDDLQRMKAQKKCND